MSDILNENLLMTAQKGSILECQKVIAQGADINYVDSEGNSVVSFAVTGGHLDLVRYLIAEGAPVDIPNAEGNTPLHLACEKDNREIILALLIGGADATKKNNNEAKPGDKSASLGLFVKQITVENKAFNALSPEQKKKLKTIFDEITREEKHISLELSKQFNIYVNEVNEEEAENDARDFISSCALCNKEKVNLDEWLFAFAKLWVCDEPAYLKFMEDYENTLDRKGPFC